MNQRWRLGRCLYRIPDECINTREYEIEETHSDTIVREFIRTHHYLRTTPPAHYRFCLRRGSELVRVAVYAHPTNDRSITSSLGCAVCEGVELSRLVLLNEVPGNGESFFVAECHRRLRKRGLAGVVSFSDPQPRQTSDGSFIMPGHVGTVYQALSGRFVGRSATRTLRLLPDGSVLSDRALQKLRAGEPGTRAIRESLATLGVHLPPGPIGEALNPLLDRYTRRLRHHGNYKYLWAFSRAAERFLPPGLPYPKLDPLFYYGQQMEPNVAA